MRSTFPVIALLTLGACTSDMWTELKSVDPMTDSVTSAHAYSPRVRATEPMEPPSYEIEAWLRFDCNNDSERAFIQFSDIPRVRSFGGFRIVRARIRWDDEVDTIRFVADPSRRLLRFPSDSLSIRKLESHSTVLIELPWLGQGDTYNAYFRFPLEGASTAIRNVRAMCG